MFGSKAAPRISCLLGLLAFLSTPLGAQDAPTNPAQNAAATARATGWVRTARGLPVPGATIRLAALSQDERAISADRAWVTWTDENGRFGLPGLPAGRYRIEAQQLGFDPASQEIILAAPSADDAPIEITLRVAPLATSNPQAATPTQAANPPAQAPGPRSAGVEASGVASARKPGQRARSIPAEIIRQRIRQGGFQQVDPAGQGGSGQEANGQAEAQPPDAASSSDAFLISGTVGRRTSAGNESGFGPFGGMGQIGGVGEAGGFPSRPDSMPGAGVGAMPQRPGGPGMVPPGAGHGQRGSSAAAGTPWGLQRILRQQANRIRLSFYDRYGNSALDARPYSLTQTNPAKISTWRERYGANVGGPLRIPRVYDGREKTFFFVNLEEARSRDPVDTFATVPLPEERRGDFSARGVQLFDPRSNLARPRTALGSSIPPERLDPAAVGLLRFIPLPNQPGLVQNFHLQTRVPTATDRLNVRLLHTISPKLNAQVVYNLSQTRTQTVQSFPELRSRQSVRAQNVMLGLTQNWTQRLIHDTRVFWSRSRTESLNRFAFIENIAGELGIAGISTSPVNFGVPQISLTNFTDVSDPVPALRRNQTLRFLDNVAYLRPKHTLRTGLEIRRMQINARTDPAPRGAFTFTGLMTSQLDASGRPIPGTGFDLADFLLGLPQATTVRFGTSSTYFRSWAFVGYFQDDWRIHPRFSLNWGARYEVVTPPVELFDHIANLDVNADFTAVAAVLPGQAAPFSGRLPRALVRGDFNNWSPRAGFAWKPPLKWAGKHPVVVRAGYGVFYNGSIYSQLAASMANQPPFAQAQTRLTSEAQVLTLENGFPPAPPGTVRNTVAVDPNYRVGYAQIWNLAVEAQLAPSTIAEVTYTGTKGTHLDLLRAPNRAPHGSPLDTDQSRRISNALGFTYDTSGASSIYHAFQIRLQRRLAHGLMFQGLYTYGKSIDNASSIGGGTPVVVQNDANFRLERGLSSFDIRHQFRSSCVYELPFGERKRWVHRGWAAALLGRWQLSGNTTIATGTPFTARVLGSAADNSGTGAGFSQRADQVGNASLPHDVRAPLHFFNTAAFILPPPGRFGDAARNTIPGPGSVSFNFALARWIPFGKDERHRIDFRWEFSNLANTPNFAGLATVVNSAIYGRVLGTRPMRTMDIVLRVSY